VEPAQEVRRRAVAASAASERGVERMDRLPEKGSGGAKKVS
jgi:hypothetical protein